MTTMTTVRDVLDRKGRQVYSVNPEDSVYRALEIMSDHRVGALMVVDSGKLVGVVSEPCSTSSNASMAAFRLVKLAAPARPAAPAPRGPPSPPPSIAAAF